MKSFKEFLLQEKNAIVDYYLKNPDKLINIESQMSKKAEKKYGYEWLKSIALKTTEYNELSKNRTILLKKLQQDFLEFKEVNKKNDNYNDIPYNLEYLDNYFFDRLSKNKKIIGLEKFKTISILNTLYHRDYVNAYINKLSMNYGVSEKILIDTFSQLALYRESSGQKIPKEMIPAIKALTVTNNIPSKIYRGWFLDGEKIDKIKNIENLKVGDKLSFNFGKITSWTTNKSVAEAFTTSQDNIKDVKNGYAMIISYQPTKDEIVADLRDEKISNFTGYYNQQEILLDTGKKDFIIDYINKGNSSISNRSIGNIWDTSFKDFVLETLTSNKPINSDNDLVIKKSLELVNKSVKDANIYLDLNYYENFLNLFSDNNIREFLKINRLSSKYILYTDENINRPLNITFALEDYKNGYILKISNSSRDLSLNGITLKNIRFIMKLKPTKPQLFRKLEIQSFDIFENPDNINLDLNILKENLQNIL